MGCSYTYIVVCFSFGSLFHICIEKMFQATGNMVIPMFLQALGAIVNLILDPILIFGWMGIPAMGVTGAAVATIIGQMTACFSKRIGKFLSACGDSAFKKAFSGNCIR